MTSQIAQTLSVLLGGLSLLGFFAVLLAGPFELVPLGLRPEAALAWDAGLCLAFFAQHSYREYQREVPMLVPWRVPAEPKNEGVR